MKIRWQAYGKTGFRQPQPVIPIITSGLTTYYDAATPESYSGSGTDWNDLGTNGDTATINGATWNSDGYFYFDGSNDTVTNVLSSAPTTNNTTPQTISMWIYPTRLSTWQRILVISPGSGYFANNIIQLRGDDNKIRFLDYNTDVYVDLKSNSAVSINTWVEITFVNDGSKVSMYINGTKQTENPTITSRTYPTYTYTVMGAGTSANLEPWQGRLSTLSIYDRALSQTEITNNYNAIASRY